MLAPLRHIASDPALRLAAALLFLFGAFVSTIAPYQSLIAIETFGLSHRTYAGLLVAAAVVFLTGSVTLGILSDHHLSRRTTAALHAAFLTSGAGLMTALPGPGAFVVAHGLLLPAGSAIFAQSFALVRLASANRTAAERAAIHSATRAIFALPFVVVLPLWSLAFARGTMLLNVYPVMLALAAAMVLLILSQWPRNDDRSGRNSGLRFRAALRELSSPRLLSRAALMGGLLGAVGLYMTLIGLVFADAGRGAGDVALYVGFVAGAEVPFMLALSLAQRRAPIGVLIAVGAAIYACHLAFLPLLAATPFVWGLILFAALGGAAILTLPIAYLQDLMADRPGAAASLMAVQRIASDVTCALAFALGTRFGGYWLAALMGSAISVGAALLLLRIDRSGV